MRNSIEHNFLDGNGFFCVCDIFSPIGHIQCIECNYPSKFYKIQQQHRHRRKKHSLTLTPMRLNGKQKNEKMTGAIMWPGKKTASIFFLLYNISSHSRYILDARCIHVPGFQSSQLQTGTKRKKFNQNTIINWISSNSLLCLIHSNSATCFSFFFLIQIRFGRLMHFISPLIPSRWRTLPIQRRLKCEYRQERTSFCFFIRINFGNCIALSILIIFNMHFNECH